MSQVSSDIGSGYDHDLPRILTTQEYIDQGYVFYECDIVVEDINMLIAALKNESAAMTIDMRVFNQRLIIKTEEVIITSNGYNNNITVQAKTQEGLLNFLTKHSDIIRKHDNESISIEYFLMAKGDEVKSRFMTLRFNQLPNVISELYPDIDIDALSRAFKASDYPILLLYGIPGVGKTTYLKYMLKTREYKRIAYVKDMQVMQSSDFWSSIATNNYDLIVFDDLDFALGPREEGQHSSFISNLLSYSDGIFNHSRSKIVITTNQNLDRIDNALVRPGRCFDFLVLEPLTFGQAYDIWTGVLGMSATEFHRLYANVNTITQAALMSDYKRIQDASMERSYIKGDNRFYTIESKLGKYGIAADGHRHLGFTK